MWSGVEWSGVEWCGVVWCGRELLCDGTGHITDGRDGVRLNRVMVNSSNDEFDCIEYP